MAKVVFTPYVGLESASSTEEKLRLLSDRIDSLERDLEYILSNLDEDNMKSSDVSGT